MISQILDKLYVGDIWFSESELAPRGIGHVVNVSGAELSLKCQYTHIHLRDDGHNQPSDFATVLATIEDSLSRGWGTLVCCRAGMSRSVFIVMLWLERMGMSREEAYAFVKQRHPIAQVNPDLWRSL